MRKKLMVAAIILSSHAIAQDTAQLDQVVITANKFSTKTTETGKVVVVINRQDIERAGSRDLSQVISELGGVFINGYTSNPGKEKNIYLRGAKVDHTLITVDGIPVYDASGIGSNFDIRYFPVDNIERIEILKGSQGTLYGSDAIAGVINIITRKGTEKPSLTGIAHYGSFITKRAHLGYSARRGIFSYNLGLNHLSTDGFSEARPPAGSTEAFDKDGYSNNNISFQAGIQPLQNMEFRPFIRYSYNKADLDQDAFTDEKDFTSRAGNLQAGISNQFRFGSNSLHILYQYNHTNRKYLDDSSTVNGYYFFNQSRYIAREHFAEAFAVIPFGSFRMTTGVDFRSSNTDFNALQRTIFSPALVPSSFSGDSVKQHQQSFYASLHFNSGIFSIEAGGRSNMHSVYGSNLAWNFNPSVLLSGKLKFFANLSSGYKVPSLYQLFSIYGNKALQPEQSLNLEGGVQYFIDNNSAVRATYFKRRVNDVIAFFYDAATWQSRYINQDQQHDHGIEIDGRIAIGNKFQIRALYSFVDGEITTRQNGKDTTYFNLLRRPKSNLNLGLGYQATSRLFLNAQLNAVGNSRDIYFDPSTWQASDITLQNYLLLNFYAEYRIRNEKLTLFADLRNLLDKDYSDIYGYNTAGFNAYGGIRFRL